MKIAPKLKIGVIMAIFVLVFISGAIGFVLFNKERLKAQGLEKKIQLILKDKEAAEAKLKSAKDGIANLNKALTESNDKITALSKQIEDEKSSRDALQIQVDQLSSQLTSEKQTKEALQKKVSSLEGDLENFLSRLKEIEQQKTDLEQQLKQYEEHIKLDKITVKPDGDEANATISRISGKIVSIKKEHGFLVIDIGGNHGAEEGDIFSVYHNSQYIGDVVIERVQPTMSAATFSDNLQLNSIRESDTVIKKD